MANLSAAQLELLLGEAEQRLQSVPANAPPPVSTTVSITQTGESFPSSESQHKPKDELALRLPHSASKQKQDDSAGAKWFNLPKTNLTPEFKRDWNILRMRGVLDPKHQKKTLRAEPPRYSQVGEVITGPLDYFGGRLTRKQKGKTLVEEAMLVRNDSKLKNKYAGIQKSKSSGKKAFYQRLVQERRRGK